MSQQRIEQLIDDLHKPLLELRHQQRPTRSLDGADDDMEETDDDDDDDDDDADVKHFQLKHFNDAVFSFLRQAAAQRAFSPCVEVARLFDST